MTIKIKYYKFWNIFQFFDLKISNWKIIYYYYYYYLFQKNSRSRKTEIFYHWHNCFIIFFCIDLNKFQKFSSVSLQVMHDTTENDETRRKRPKIKKKSHFPSNEYDKLPQTKQIHRVRSKIQVNRNYFSSKMYRNVSKSLFIIVISFLNFQFSFIFSYFVHEFMCLTSFSLTL